MSETEIERLVVNLVGDNSSYTEMIDEASEATSELAKAEKFLQDVEDQRNAMMKEGEALTLAMRTEVEKYADDLSNLNNLLAEGAIDQETYDRAVEKASEGVDKLDKALQDAEVNLVKVGAALVVVGGSLTAALTVPIMAFGKESLAAFGEAEQGSIKLDAAIKANGEDVAETRKVYDEFANSMQAMTVLDDDAVLSILRVAESFDLTGEAAKTASKDAIALGALNDQSAESMLRITAAMAKGDVKTAMLFARSVKQLRGIKTEAEFVAKYTDKIADGMAQAEAVANSFNGQLAQLSNGFGNLMEDIGEIIAVALRPLVAFVKSTVAWFKELSYETKTVIVVVATLVAALGPFIAFVGVLIGGLAGLSVTMTILTAAGTTLGALFTPLGAAVVAIVAAVAALIVAFVAFEAATGFFSGVVSDIGTIFGETATDIKVLFTAAVIGARQALAEWLPVLRQTTEGIRTGITLALISANIALREFLGLTGKTPKHGGEGKLLPVAPKVPEVPKLTDENKKLTESLTELDAKLQDQINTFGMVGSEAEIFRLRVAGLSAEALKGVQAMADNLVHKELTKDIEDTTKALQDQVKWFKLTADQVKLEKLRERGATDVELADAEKAMADLKVLTDEKKALEELDKVVKQDHTVKLGVTGVDAVAAGSAEAMARIEEYKSIRGGTGILGGTKSGGNSLVASQSKIGPSGVAGENRVEVYLRELVEISRAQAAKQAIFVEAAGIA